MSNSRANIIFQNFLSEKAKEKSDKILGELLNNYAIPLMKPIIIRGLQNGNNHYDKTVSDADDLLSEIVLSFINRAEGFRLKKELKIENIEAYFRTSAKLKIQDYRREQNPNWCMLRNRIRYLFDTNSNLVYLKDEKLCCLKNKEVLRSDFSANDLVEILKQKDLISALTELFDAIKIILREARGGLLLNDLVNVIFELQNIETDMPDIPIEDTIRKIAHNALGGDEQLRLEARMRLGKIWHEIQQLPFNQRFTLLLNMQEKGFSGIHLLLFLQITTIAELSERLRMTMEEFAEVYNNLPLPDNEIAEMLKITEKQASNFRKVARERLQRKLKNIE
jgi:DNA-directed RNA polymerase specialized sigma24 family protein